MSPLIFSEGYQIGDGTAEIENTGHTIGVKFSTEKYIKGGPLLNNEPYIFAQLHFHWGNDDTEGSEHTLNGKK